MAADSLDSPSVLRVGSPTLGLPILALDYVRLSYADHPSPLERLAHRLAWLDARLWALEHPWEVRYLRLRAVLRRGWTRLYPPRPSRSIPQ